MDIHLLSYYIGIFIVFVSHAYNLFNKPTEMMKNHSWLNIFAAMLIAYYFMNKENIWAFDVEDNSIKEKFYKSNKK
jgi:hypothetical protein